MKKNTCKYCGIAYKSDICHNCKKKLQLIRKLQKMVRNKAEEVGYFEKKNELTDKQRAKMGEVK